VPRGQGRVPRSGAHPEEGKWVQAKEIKDISGLTHGIGWCAPQQGACKLTLNIKDGVIEEALVETIGCSGMTHSAAMASEILIGKTILEALNTDLVCDAINTAMRELFLQIVYGRSQTAFSEGGLPIGAAWRTWARACAPRSAPCTPPRKGPPLSGDGRGLRHPRRPEQGRRDRRLRVRQLGKMMEAPSRRAWTPTRRWKRPRATTASSTNAAKYHRSPSGIRKEELKMALFESYERRIDKINSVLAEYGIGSMEECREICKASGLRPLRDRQGHSAHLL
jgi:NifU-like protein involved in Fe-S cluster formation